MEKVHYYNLEQFAGLYIEDSYVLQIIETNGLVTFKMELVLSETHPCYFEPLIDEAYCYRNGVIKFIKPMQVEWVEKNLQRLSVDANGDIDQGNIDFFYKVGDNYLLEGDWGKLIIGSCTIEVEIL